MSWENAIMYMATISKYKPEGDKETDLVSPEDEESDLRKMLGD